MGTSSADKKAEFRKYLEDSGVMDAVVKSLVLLYQEPTKPGDPLAFVAEKLGVKGGDCAEKDKEIAALKGQLEELKEKLGKHEPHPEAAVEPAAAAPAEPKEEEVAPVVEAAVEGAAAAPEE